MAGNVKGITIEFSGDTTKLDRSLRDVQKSTKQVDTELRAVNRSLKFNPTSVDLWRQKQALLTQKINDTRKKLDLLKQKQKNMDAAGVDKNSEQYRKLQREIIETESKLKHFEGELRKVGDAKLTALGNQFKAFGEKITAVGKELTTKVTVPLVALGVVSAKKFAEVDKTMQLTNSTMANTEEEAQLLNTAMKNAAASSTYGMSDAATATLNFARAGLDAKDAADALAPAMALAAGEGGNLDTVSAGLVATINGFGDSFDKAGDYADVFANACNNSALDIDSLSEAMSIAAPVFKTAGYSVNDAALYMGAMANAGIPASEAANALKTGMSRLVDPTEKAANWLDKLGISVVNSDGTMKDSLTVQKDLHDAFSSLSESEQISAASAIFGKTQMSKWLALINTAPGDVDALSTALDKEGTAMKMQSAMMSGFGGSIEQLKSGIDVLATSLGEALAPMIQKVVGWVQSLVNWFNSLSPQMQTVIATVGVIAAALGPVLVIVGMLASSIGSIISLIGVIGPTIAALAGPVGIAIAVIGGLIAVGVLLYKNWDKITAKTKAMVASVTKAIDNMKARISAKFNEIKTSITTAWNNVKTATSNAWNAIKNAIINPIQSAYNKVKSIIDKVKSFFPIKVSKLFGHIDLPHFKLTGKFSLKPPSVPKLDIDWYKTGGIFNSPTVYPIGIGEAGPEAVIPLDKFWKEIRGLSGNSVTVNIYPREGQSAYEIAQEVKRIIIKETKDRRLAW